MTNYNQYEKIGLDFIKGQKDYFSNRTDHARKFIKSRLPDLNGKNILDAGCGHGIDIITYEKFQTLQ